MCPYCSCLSVGLVSFQSVALHHGSVVTLPVSWHSSSLCSYTHLSLSFHPLIFSPPPSLSLSFPLSHSARFSLLSFPFFSLPFRSFVSLSTLLCLSSGFSPHFSTLDWFLFLFFLFFSFLLNIPYLTFLFLNSFFFLSPTLVYLLFSTSQFCLSLCTSCVSFLSPLSPSVSSPCLL